MHVSISLEGYISLPSWEEIDLGVRKMDMERGYSPLPALCTVGRGYCRGLASWESPGPLVLKVDRGPGAFRRRVVGWFGAIVCGWVPPSLERHVELRLKVSCTSWLCPASRARSCFIFPSRRKLACFYFYCMVASSSSDMQRKKRVLLQDVPSKVPKHQWSSFCPIHCPFIQNVVFSWKSVL